MPFCTNCGSTVEPQASFCPNCGAAQPKKTIETADFLEGMSDRTASILCYIPVFGIIPAIIFLATHKFRTHAGVRFDAFQSLYLFVAWLVVSTAIPTLFWGNFHPSWIEGLFLGAIKLVVFICWIYLLIKAAQQEQVRLPLIGDLAARSAAEQI
ncbi:MAG TPA: zinc-ribbon domain-containing protein [Bryobacteraceae bacterium]|nr:zinc-ribbon domain-containing protein [Bryobacteraceae bacterium]